MDEELYSYDKYRDCHIFCIKEHNKYFYTVRWNGTNVYECCSYTPEKGLGQCKSWIEGSEENI